MPWKECSVMDERLRFVARLLDGEAMSEVCRAFGISRKTGYKIFERYKEHGLEALTDRSRRPASCRTLARKHITEHSFHGIHASPGKGKGVTHVSGTICHLCLGPLTANSRSLTKAHGPHALPGQRCACGTCLCQPTP